MKIRFLFLFLLFSGIISAQNNPPIANPDSFSTYAGVLKTISKISITSNDYDPDGNSLYLDTTFYYSNNATISYVGTPGNYIQIKYTPDSFFYGTDTIYYLICDNGAPSLCASSYIIMTVLYKTYESYGFLDVNNISARINAGSSLFWDLNMFPSFEVPKGSNKHTIFNGELWIGGLDSNDSLHISAQRYGSYTGDTSWWWGPISNNYSFSLDTSWNRVWKIKKSDVDSFITWFNTGVPSNYIIQKNIQTWPAHGDILNGQSFYLAPFVDFNNDGIYYPADGDYPAIKGDETVLFIFNDGRNQISTALKVEVIAMAYAFECSQNDPLYNTVFLNYKIINKSGAAYDSVFTGLYSDGDIGCFSDDFVETDVSKGLIYYYNGDYADGNPCSAAPPGDYGIYPPAQGCIFLKGPRLPDDSNDNPISTCDESINGFGFGDGIIDNEYMGMKYSQFYDFFGTYNGAPLVAWEFYKAMSGYWKDGQHIIYGGCGHPACCNPPFSCVQANYIYPALSDTLGYGTNCNPQSELWTDVTSGNTPGDRNGMMSTGPFNLDINDTIELEFAFIFAQDSTISQSIALMHQYVDSIRYYYKNQITSCDLLTWRKTQKTMEFTLHLFPDPANEEIYIYCKRLSGSTTINIYDGLGKHKLKIYPASDVTKLPLENFADGIYLVQVMDGNIIKTKKFIKTGL